MKKLIQSILVISLVFTLSVGFFPLTAYADEDMTNPEIEILHDSKNCPTCSASEYFQTFGTGTTHAFYVQMSDGKKPAGSDVSWKLVYYKDYDGVIKAEGNKCLITFNQTNLENEAIGYTSLDIRADVRGKGYNTTHVQIQDGYKYVKDLLEAEITLSRNEYTYDGKAKKPTVKVVFQGKTLKKGKDYTVSYSDNVSVGRCTVTVKAKKGSEYAGEASTFFNINKKIKASTIKNKSVTFSIVPKNGKGKYNEYSLSRVTDKKYNVCSKYFKLSKSGKLTVKKGTPKGKYWIEAQYFIGDNYERGRADLYVVVA